MQSRHLGVIFDFGQEPDFANSNILALSQVTPQLDTVMIFRSDTSLRPLVHSGSEESSSSQLERLLAKLACVSNLAVEIYDCADFDENAVANCIGRYVTSTLELNQEDHLVVSLDNSPMSQMVATQLLQGNYFPSLRTQVTELTQEEVTVVRSNPQKCETYRRGKSSLLLWESAALIPFMSTFSDRQNNFTLTLHQIPRSPDAVNLVSTEGGPADLSSARLVVVIGGGVRDPSVVSKAESIAALLKGKFGATRVICDLGLLPYSYQIGTTGVSIAPEVLLSFGVSGAVQHLGAVVVPLHSISVNSDRFCAMARVSSFNFESDASTVLDLLFDYLSPKDELEQV